MKEYMVSETSCKARPMTRGDYIQRRGWTLPVDEDPNDEGFLIRRKGSPESWMPKELFLMTHREYEGMSFGQAIEALKAGKKVCRAGWNGKGMYIAMQTGSVITSENARGGVAKCMAKDGVEEITIGPHVGIKTPNNEAWAWNASQQDLFAEDWMVIE